MTNVLLLCLNLQLAAVVVYAVTERLEAKKYRRDNLQAQEDSLVYDDLMARVVLRRPSVVTRLGHQDEAQAQGDDKGEVVGAESANGSHVRGSFRD